MELVKAIIALITSFFQRSTVETKKEVKLADAQTAATVETIRATENAAAVQQRDTTEQALAKLYIKQEAERIEQSKQSLDEQIDEQFGKG